MQIEQVLSVNNINLKVLLFDDYHIEDDGNVWAYVCDECKNKYRLKDCEPNSLDTFCGLANCYNISGNYINLKGDVKL